MRFVLPDTSLIWNLHAVGRLDLLPVFLGLDRLQPVRAEWSQEVEQELLRHIPAARSTVTAVLAAPVRPSPAQIVVTQQLRRSLFARPGDGPRAHLGEAETLAIWSERAAIADRVLCLTEDRDLVRVCWRSAVTDSPAHRLLGGRRFLPVTTQDLLDALLRAHRIDEAGRTGLLRELRRVGRPVIGPGASAH